MSARFSVERMFAHAKDKNLRVHFCIHGIWTYMSDIELVVSGAPVATRGIGALTDTPGIDHYANLSKEVIAKYRVPELVASDLFVYGRMINNDELRATGKSEKFEIGLLLDTNRIDAVGFSDPREHVY